MALLHIFVLFLCLVSSSSVPNRFIDREEQQFIDHLLLDSKDQPKPKVFPHPAEENDELEKERLLAVHEQSLHKAIETQNSDQFHLIKKAATAVVKRLSMPSPPNTDHLIDKAVQFVFKESHPVEHTRIRSAIKEQVEKMIFALGKEKEQGPKLKVSGLRKEKILNALEDILSEMAAQLNLTTLQVKFLVNTSVYVLAKHFGLEPWQNHQLHERVTSHVRAKLKYEDWDNKDGRLRRLEEKIEKEIISLKLTDKQARRLEALMVVEEAVRESLSKDERLRMLKRVIADIKDDFKTEKLEQESGPPKLSSVNIIRINHLIRQKALEMQLNKKELKVLGLAVLTAIENLTMHNSSTPSPNTRKTHPTKATLTFTKTSPFTRKVTGTLPVTPGEEEELEMERTKPTKQFTKKETEKDELEEELEGTKPPTEYHTTIKHTNRVKEPTTLKFHTTIEPSVEAITTKRRDKDDDLIAKLAQDEIELEKEEFQPKSAKEPKDELELELEETKPSTIKTVQVPHVTEPVTQANEVKTKSKISTKKEEKPTKVTQPNTEQLMKSTLKSPKTHPVPLSEDKELEEEILEGHVTKPTNDHVVEITKPKTEKLIVKTPTATKTEKNKLTKISTQSPLPTESNDKELEEDLLEGRVTNRTEVTQHITEHHKPTKISKHSSPPTESNEMKLEEDLLEGRVTNPTEVTQHNTEHHLKTTAPKSTRTVEMKPTKEVTNSIPPTEDVDKKLEEDLLEGRVTTPSHKTHVTHSNTEYILPPTKEPEPSKEVNRITKKNVLSRRHRVKILDDDLEGFGHQRDIKDDASLEDDLNLLEPKKTKSLEDELDEVLSQKETPKDDLLEDELKDLNIG